MALQLWINDSGHYFVDTALGGMQVGQAWPTPAGDWAVEINDRLHSASDLDAAKRLFVKLYNPKRVVASPGSDEWEGSDEEFEVIDL